MLFESAFIELPGREPGLILFITIATGNSKKQTFGYSLTGNIRSSIEDNRLVEPVN